MLTDLSFQNIELKMEGNNFSIRASMNSHEGSESHSLDTLIEISRFSNQLAASITHANEHITSPNPDALRNFNINENVI